MAGLMLPNFSQMQPGIKRDSIKVYVIQPYKNQSDSSNWPQQVLFTPRVGDMMQSDDGEVKKIIEIIHFADGGGNPAVALRLGDDNTTNTATSGGGSGATESMA